MKIRRLPRDDKTNGWSAILPPRTPHAPLRGDTSADWLVLGGGAADGVDAESQEDHRQGEQGRQPGGTAGPLPLEELQDGVDQQEAPEPEGAGWFVIAPAAVGACVSRAGKARADPRPLRRTGCAPYYIK